MLPLGDSAVTHGFGFLNTLDHPPVVTEPVPVSALIRGQQRLDPIPLLVREHPVPRSD